MNRALSILIFLLATSFSKAQYLDFSKYAWQYFDTSNSEVPSNYITDLFIDDAQSIWVSSTSEPLVMINAGGRWEDVPKSGHAARWWMNDWTQTARGRYVISGQYGYVLFFNFAYNQFDTLGIPKESPSVLESNSFGVVLVGCLGGDGSTHNLFQIINGRTVESLNDRFGDVLCIYIESNGDALVAFKQGLYRYKQKSDGTYSSKPKKIGDQAFYEVAKDSKGIIWGTCMDDGYLHRYDGEWSIIKGGPHDLHCNFRGQTRYVAHNLVILDDDRVMISTQFNTGIAIYNGEFWKGYKPELKVVNDGITRITIGPDGSVWCATSKNGLAVFRPAVYIKPRKKRVRTREKYEEIPDTAKIVFDKPVEDGRTPPYIPDRSRKVITHQTISTLEDSVMVRVWDGQKIDGDTISLYCNGEPLLKYRPLTAKQDTFWFKLKEGENEMLLFAHNLGSIPPNTVTIVITLGNKVLNAELNSDMNTCERLMIRRRRRDGSAY
ncbi:MAG: hypothetical protein LPK45_09125 [Bacteroidota bacterium]|nr:hypothetical protein [Bacteroidota bacterium]MDX5431245.1 hypothetical protein [Bacteroidota bacterium]MDX5469984.1 hypothetical protein [Bacteroidota bacterium]